MVSNNRLSIWLKDRLLGVLDELIAAMIIAVLGYLAWLIRGVLPSLIANPTTLIIVAMVMASVLTVIGVGVWRKRKGLGVMTVDEGKVTVERIERVKQGFLVVVEQGNAVVFEHAGKTTRVGGPGVIFTRPFERNRSVKRSINKLLNKRIIRFFYLFRCALSNDPALMEHDHTMRNPKGTFHLMSDYNRSDTEFRGKIHN